MNRGAEAEPPERPCGTVAPRAPSVRWYLRFGLSYRDLEELLAERGIEVDHVTLFRWVQRFTPLLIDAVWPCRHAVGDRWFVDETHVKVSGIWRYVYRAVDSMAKSSTRTSPTNATPRAATRFFATAIGDHGHPVEATTDKAHALARANEDLVPGAFQHEPVRAFAPDPTPATHAA